MHESIVDVSIRTRCGGASCGLESRFLRFLNHGRRQDSKTPTMKNVCAREHLQESVMKHLPWSFFKQSRESICDDGSISYEAHVCFIADVDDAWRCFIDSGARIEVSRPVLEPKCVLSMYDVDVLIPCHHKNYYISILHYYTSNLCAIRSKSY